MPSDHPFDRVNNFPGRDYKTECGVCGKPEAEHTGVQSANEMRALLTELADCLCGLTIVTRDERDTLLTRLATYRSPPEAGDAGD